MITPSAIRPIVDKNGLPTPEMAAWMSLVSDLDIREGSGSPEGVISARKNAIYKDTGGSAGSILYVKKLTDISGDSSQGWILI